MPRYDYVCPKCGNGEERTHGILDSKIVQCSDCGADMRKKFSAPAASFKGSGFYSTGG